MAPCLSHDDSKPSLSISERGGKLLVHCFAGCPQQTVIAALRARGLWEDKRRALIIAEYNYTDEHGELLYQVVRTDPKGFFQRYPDGRGGWVGRKHPRQVLYRLREVLDDRIGFVVEGEKGCRVSSRSRVRRNDEFRRRECGLVTAFHGSSAGKGSNSDPRRRPPAKRVSGASQEHYWATLPRL